MKTYAEWKRANTVRSRRDNASGQFSSNDDPGDTTDERRLDERAVRGLWEERAELAEALRDLLKVHEVGFDDGDPMPVHEWESASERAITRANAALAKYGDEAEGGV